VRRAAVLALLALTAALVAGCGGGSEDETSSFGGGTITIPEGVHGLYPELQALLAQYPYQTWFTNCVEAGVHKKLSAAEVEAIEKLPESKRSEQALGAISEARSVCEKTNRPLIDPNASEEELDLYRAGYVQPLREEAEAKKFSAAGIACVEEKVENLAAPKVLVLGNGNPAAGKVILLAVLSTCAKA
jgi:hypothetical protein